MFHRLYIVLMVLIASVRLTTAAAPSLQLAFLHGHGELIICDSVSIASLDGSPTQNFDLPATQTCNPPLWSPDGRHLAMASPGLLLLDMEKEKVKVIIDPTKNPLVSFPVWSRDSGYLAWTEHPNNVESWGLIKLSSSSIQHFAALPDIQIAPDEIRFWNAHNHEVFMNYSGRKAEELGYLDTNLICLTPVSLRWDNAQLLCEHDYDIESMTADTHTGMKLTNTPDLIESSPQFSPDGTQIVYQVAEISSGKSWLQIMASDGTNVRRLTKPTDENVTPVFMVSPGNDVLPQWSPDGQYIAFQRQSGYKGLDIKIYVIKADGTDLQYIGDGVVPSWRPISQS